MSLIKKKIKKVKLDTTQKIKKTNPPKTTSASNSLSKELKESIAIAAKNKEFKKALAKHRPTLDAHSELGKYSSFSRSYGKKIARLALKALSLQTAVNYANEMLVQDITGDLDKPVSNTEVLQYTIKLMRIKMIRLLAAHLEIDKIDLDHIIYNVISTSFQSSKVDPFKELRNMNFSQESPYGNIEKQEKKFIPKEDRDSPFTRHLGKKDGFKNRTGNKAWKEEKLPDMQTLLELSGYK